MAQINQLDSLLGQAKAILNMIQGRKAELNELLDLANKAPVEPPEPPAPPKDIELPDFEE